MPIVRFPPHHQVLTPMLIARYQTRLEKPAIAMLFVAITSIILSVTMVHLVPVLLAMVLV